MRKVKKEGIELFIVALASFLMLVFCIVAASPDSTLRFIDPTPANYTQEQDFTCGVLALNTHKSIYFPDEAASIGIAVLDNEGHMICDADVTLTITDPGNNETVLSTGNGLINVSPQCCVYGVTNLPDYYTNYTVDGAGTYVMNLTVTAVTADGTKSITDEFSVQNSVDFDVARDGPTRIYPSVPHVMSFTIKANKDYTGLIREYVPASFVITPQDGLIVTTVGDTKILTWTRNLVKGETYNIYYEFDAPDVSPYLFTLGALEIGNWKEARQWMIASDSPDTAYYDPTSDVQTGWDVTPAESQHYAAVADAVRDPDPPTVTDYISAAANAGKTDEHQVNKIMESGINYVRLYYYAESGNRAQIDVNLQSDGVTKASYSLPPSSSAAWHYVEWTTSSVGTITGEFTIVFASGSGGHGEGFVYAWYLEVDYTPTWESYRDPAHDYPDDTFSDDEHTVYMKGPGFALSHVYKVAYYDVDKDKVATDTINTSNSNGVLSSQYYFPTNPSAKEGLLWHSAVYDATDTPPSTYNSVDPDMIIADSFNVESSAIPEFPTVITGFAVCMLCAVAYVVMRRKEGKR